MKKVVLLLLLLTLILSHVYSQQNISDSILHQTYQRKYITHLPTNYSGNTPTPLVINLHGGSGNYLSVQGFTEMDFFSNYYEFITVYPQGIGVAPPGFSWADGRGTSADAAGIDDVGFISNLIDSLKTDYNIDSNKIYICGFSNGAFMTQRLSCEIPDKFAAVGALGCSLDTVLFNTCNPSRAIPMMYVSGTEDPEVPFGGGQMNNPAVLPIVPVDSAVQFWVNNNNCQTSENMINIPDTSQSDSSHVEYFKFSDCDCNANVRFYKVVGGGHTWPGVTISAYPQLGNTNEDMHASNKLWEFFSSHSLNDCNTHSSNKSENYLIKLYPNPANDFISIESDKRINNVLITDIVGREVLLESDNFNKLNISKLTKGIYIVKISLGDNNTETSKIILE